jgi:ribosomal protein S18 acetylase RimI-like enzyme
MRCTIVAEAGGLVGFANTFIGEDPRWGALLDNLHVAAAQKRRGIGSRLMAITAEGVIAAGAESPGMYLWVLEQNTGAQAFYRALGAESAGRAAVLAPGGLPGRLHGTPMKLRYAWPRVDVLLKHGLEAAEREARDHARARC